MMDRQPWTPIDRHAITTGKVIVLIATIIALVGLTIILLMTACKWLGCTRVTESQWFGSAIGIGAVFLLKPMLRVWEMQPLRLIIACLIAYLLIAGWFVALKAGVLGDLRGPVARFERERAKVTIRDSDGTTWNCHARESAPTDSILRYACENGRVLTFSRDGRVLMISDEQKDSVRMRH